jgi:hypothetical protein
VSDYLTKKNSTRAEQTTTTRAGGSSHVEPPERAARASEDAGGAERADRAERTLDALERLELLRGRLVEVESLAHAAAGTLGRLPFVPWPSHDDHALQARLNYDRLPYLVSATADAAYRTLVECAEAIRALA